MVVFLQCLYCTVGWFGGGGERCRWTVSYCTVELPSERRTKGWGRRMEDCGWMLLLLLLLMGLR